MLKERSVKGIVSKSHFVEALEELGVPLGELNAHDTNTLWAAIDVDGSGTVDLFELKAAIGLVLDPAADGTFEKLLMAEGSALARSVQRIRERLAAQAERVINLFKSADKDNGACVPSRRAC